MNKLKFNFNKLLYNLTRIELKNYFNSAIIVAAGIGSRMNSDVTKQLMTVGDMPIVVRTIMQFENCKDINEIIIVTRKEEFEQIKAFIKQYKFKKITHVVSGGDTRQQSVLNGLTRVDKRSEFVTIHDGVRCMVTPEIIGDVCSCAYRYGCATAAAPSKDTVKLADSKGFIKETADRDYVYLAQTPQIFRTDIYRTAAIKARHDGFNATDDNSLVENIGFKVFLCNTGYENIKITTPEDIDIAEAILKKRNGND